MNDEKPKVKYALNTDSLCFERTDQHGDVSEVARYDPETGNLGFLPGMLRYRVRLFAHMNDKDYKIGDFSELSDPQEEPQEIPTTPGAPPRPKMDPRAGDKSPKLMEWLWKYRRAEFNARYGYLGEDENGRPITARKTPFSVVAESVPQEEDEFEWDPSLDPPKS
jgi:hypothetical protein